MIADDELVMLSALQHYLFCPRQCALIHIDGAWSENYLTASGRQLHERVDRIGGETRRDVHLATALRLISARLGIMGVADMVEFHLVPSEYEDDVRVAAPLAGRSGSWRPFPVEYKRGRPKPHRADEVQLCAQALCLEEMLGVSIPEGALFYGETRKRTSVVFDGELRALTEETIVAVRRLLTEEALPPAAVSKGCQACSLYETCQPKTTSGHSSAEGWIRRQLGEQIS